VKRFETILVHREPGGVLVATLNRPAEHNAVSRLMHDEFIYFLQALREEPDVGAVVLTGAGKSFCAGGSMELIDELRAAAPSGLDRMLEDGVTMVREMLSARPPIVIAMNGSAIGLGATIALLGDFIVMSEDAKIADPHVKVGLVAGDGGTVAWPSRIGLARAKEFLLTGDALDATSALSLGLVNRVVPRDDVVATAMEWAGRLAQGPRHAIAYTKQALNAPLLRDAAVGMPLAMSLEGRTFNQPDVEEGTRAFREKRPPRWPSAHPAGASDA
jgi:enoyl-CoA hydratase